MRVVVVVAVLSLVCGCSLVLKDGVFECAVDDDCPAGFMCRSDGLCYRVGEGDDAGMDARTGDASRDGEAGGADADAAPDSAVSCTMDSECDDSIGCTTDRCADGSCEHTPDDEVCPGAMCRRGVCDLAMGCQLMNDPGVSCDDGELCNGEETCDAAGDCISSGVSPCLAPTRCEGSPGCVWAASRTTTAPARRPATRPETACAPGARSRR